MKVYYEMSEHLHTSSKVSNTPLGGAEMIMLNGKTQIIGLYFPHEIVSLEAQYIIRHPMVVQRLIPSRSSIHRPRLI